MSYAKETKIAPNCKKGKEKNIQSPDFMEIK